MFVHETPNLGGQRELGGGEGEKAAAESIYYRARWLLPLKSELTQHVSVDHSPFLMQTCYSSSPWVLGDFHYVTPSVLIKGGEVMLQKVKQGVNVHNTRWGDGNMNKTVHHS